MYYFKKILFLLGGFLFVSLQGCMVWNAIKDKMPPPHRVRDGILFSYDSPSAKMVYLTGDFCNWPGPGTELQTLDKQKKLFIKKNPQGIEVYKLDKGVPIPLKKDKKGIWRVIIKLKPGRYKYKFLVNGSDWVKDPNGESAGDVYDNSLVIVD